MSVLIRGMEMPKNCQDCPLNYDQMACIVTGTRWWSDKVVLMNFESEKERLYDCPLIEVKIPHGDLADKDKLMTEVMDSDLDNLQRDDWKEVIQIVSDADVVIEAEGSEE